MEAASKKPANRKPFETGFPFKRPTAGMQGGVKGIYSDLEILVGIAIDPSGSIDCLTRSNGGRFVWSERTMNKTESATTEDKLLKFVLSMFALFLNLILDVKESLLQGTFFK